MHYFDKLDAAEKLKLGIILLVILLMIILLIRIERGYSEIDKA